MRKPVYLAVLGISIVVAAGFARRHPDALPRPARVLPDRRGAGGAQPPPDAGIPATPPEQWNNLFAPGDGMKMASRLPAANAKAASQAPRTAFVLVGTIVSSTPSARRAILWANGMKEPKAFREKEEVEPGAILSSVERDKAWITRGKEREKLEILPVGSRARPTATAIPPPLPLAPRSASPDTPPRPGPAASPPPPPDRTQAVAAPRAASGRGGGRDLSPRERRRRSRGSRW